MLVAKLLPDADLKDREGDVLSVGIGSQGDRL
jgi:hypothetical protein